jgi:predicted PurR-regulated permease PerM
VLVCLFSAILLLAPWQARSILLLLFAGIIGELILTTLTTKLQSLIRMRRRGVAFAMVICATVTVLAIGIGFRGPALVRQIGDLCCRKT